MGKQGTTPVVHDRRQVWGVCGSVSSPEGIGSGVESSGRAHSRLTCLAGSGVSTPPHTTQRSSSSPQAGEWFSSSSLNPKFQVVVVVCAVRTSGRNVPSQKSKVQRRFICSRE